MVDGERRRAELGGVGEEVRDFMVERAAQIGEGDVRLVFARLWREACVADGRLAAGGEASEVGRRIDAGPERGGLAAAEAACAVERDVEGGGSALSKATPEDLR